MDSPEFQGLTIFRTYLLHGIRLYSAFVGHYNKDIGTLVHPSPKNPKSQISDIFQDFGALEPLQ